jgi:hypothetical protein
MEHPRRRRFAADLGAAFITTTGDPGRSG